MVVTFRTAKNIRFPVYKIGSSDWEKCDGLLFIDGELVDDKNMPGDSIGIRRIQTPHKNLYKLNKQIDSLHGILKQSLKTFIDSNGTPFIYEKTLMCQLKYYKIIRVEQKEVASLIWCKDIKHPFTVPRPPEQGMTWAGVLHFHGLPWILYEYSEEKKKDTRRKV